MYLTSPFHLQPSFEFGHATTRDRTSRFIKLSRNICNVTLRGQFKDVVKTELHLGTVYIFWDYNGIYLCLKYVYLFCSKASQRAGILNLRI